MKTIIFANRAARQLDGLPISAQDQILEALTTYAVWGKGDVKRLQGRTECRLRVGRYRVIFDEDRATILAVHIGKRETTTYSRS